MGSIIYKCVECLVVTILNLIKSSLWSNLSLEFNDYDTPGFRKVYVKSLFFVLIVLINKYFKKGSGDNVTKQRPIMRYLVLELADGVRKIWPKTG